MTFRACKCKCEELYIEQQRKYLHERIFDGVLIGTIVGIAIIVYLL